MEPATGPKRLRIEPQATNMDSKLRTPIEVATEQIETHTASLQSQLGTIVNRAAKTHLAHLVKYHHKTSQLSKMADDDTFIPRSARFRFQLKATKATEHSTELQALRDETDEVISRFQKEIKTKIVAATKLEIKTLKTAISNEFCSHLLVITQAWLIAASKDNIDPHKMVHTLLERHPDTITATSEADVATLKRAYCVIHHLDALPAPFESTATAQETFARARSQRSTQTDTRSPFFNAPAPAPSTENTQPDEQPAPPPTPTDEDRLLAGLKRTLESVFNQAWNFYLKQEKAVNITQSLKQLTSSHFDQKATADAAMDIDQEPPVNRQQMNNLVQSEVDRRTKKLEAELNRLRNTLAPKTQKQAPKNPKQRGSSSGPSSKKKDSAPKAAGAANDSSRNNKNKKKKAAPNSKKKSPNSATSKKRDKSTGRGRSKSRSTNRS